MRPIECVLDSNSKGNRGPPPSFNPLLRFPEVWNPTLDALELGSATGFTKETIIPQCRALAGRWVLHPPHFALLFLSAEPANSWMSANRKLSGLDGGFSPVEVGISSGNQAPTRCAFVGTNPTDELITYWLPVNRDSMAQSIGWRICERYP